MDVKDLTIEVVRGGLTEERSGQITELWERHGVLEGEAARTRLPAVVCVGLDPSGNVVAVNSVIEEAIPLVERPFWSYSSFAPDGSEEIAAAMFNAAFDALSMEFAPGDGPIGLCVAVQEREVMERNPEPVWPATELLFAGYLPGGSQLRIRYFHGAKIGPGLPDSPSLDDALTHDYTLEHRYRIVPLSEGDVTHDDVLELWSREGVVEEAEARRRVFEVSLVAVDSDDAVAGVSSVYLQRNPTLGMDLWHYRTYVSGPHRQSNLAAQLIFHNFSRLAEQFKSGEDTRAAGLLFELENRGMMMHLNNALWPHSGFIFIGENEYGHHVRVRYFEGAEVPPPPEG